MSEVDDQQMRETLVSAYRQVVDMGLTDQASGNLSCRVAEGMLISCSGATAKNLTADRVVKVRNDGSWDGEVKPSSEWRMHQAIYQRHEKANAVVHTHSDYCVALACNNQPLPGFHYMVGTLEGGSKFIAEHLCAGICVGLPNNPHFPVRITFLGRG